MFGQSALVGRIAGETIGSICNQLGVGGEAKHAIQAVICSVAGSATAIVTLDPAGAALNLVQIANYATGNRLPESVLDDTLTLLKTKSPG